MDKKIHYTKKYLIKILMSLEYDRSAHIYSPDGRIYQLEYAMKSMNHGTTSLGICTEDAVIIISEKKIINRLQITDSITKHHLVYDHIGMAYSGIRGDARTVCKIAQRFALHHMQLYQEGVSINSILKSICDISLQFTEDNIMKKIFSRPFGAYIMMGAVEEEPFLYLLDPSGSYKKHKIKVIGSAYEALSENLESNFINLTGEEEIIRKGIDVMGGSMKDKINSDNIEIMIIRKNKVEFVLKEKITEFL